MSAQLKIMVKYTGTLYSMHMHYSQHTCAVVTWLTLKINIYSISTLINYGNWWHKVESKC